MEESQVFESRHLAVLSPNNDYIASLTQQNLYVQHSDTLQPACTFSLPPPDNTKDSSSIKKDVTEQSIQWSFSSKYVMLLSENQILIYSLQDSTLTVTISNGSGSLGKIASVEVLTGGQNDLIMVVWEFGRVNVWDVTTGRATELGDVKIGLKRNPWVVRRRDGDRPEVLVLLSRQSGQDVLTFYTPPELAPFKTVVVPTVDAQSLAWSLDGRWLSVLDSYLGSPQLHIYSTDGHPFRQYPPINRKTTLVTSDNVNSNVMYDFKSQLWSKDGLFLAESRSITVLNTRTFSLVYKLECTVETATAWRENIDVAGQRSHSMVLGQMIPQPPSNISFFDMRLNAGNTFLSCRDQAVRTTLYIWSTHSRQLHTILYQHTNIVSASWHPNKPELLLIVCSDASLHILDVESKQTPIHLLQSFEKHVNFVRLEANWLSQSFSDKLAILLTCRTIGYQLLWPQGRPQINKDQALDMTENVDESRDSLFDILTGRTPLPELKVKPVDLNSDEKNMIDATEKFDDTFQSKRNPAHIHTRNGTTVNLEDDSEIF